MEEEEVEGRTKKRELVVTMKRLQCGALPVGGLNATTECGMRPIFNRVGMCEGVLHAALEMQARPAILMALKSFPTWSAVTIYACFSCFAFLVCSRPHQRRSLFSLCTFVTRLEHCKHRTWWIPKVAWTVETTFECARHS